MSSGWMMGMGGRRSGGVSCGNNRFTNSDNRGETVRTVAINDVGEMVKKRDDTTGLHNNINKLRNRMTVVIVWNKTIVSSVEAVVALTNPVQTFQNATFITSEISGICGAEVQ